jgi:tetratricopeptide (TPR) repeat protein
MQKYNEAESEELREQIAPFLAAHSSASGDKETVKNMLVVAAQTAQKYGSTDIAKSAYDRFMAIDEKKEETQPGEIALENVFGGIGLNAQSYITNGEENIQVTETAVENISTEEYSFSEIRNSIVNDYLFGNYTTSGNRAFEYTEIHSGNGNIGETLQLLVIAAKSFLEAGDIVKAETCIRKAESILKERTEPVYECLLENVNTAYHFYTGNYQASMNSMNKAASLTQSLSGEMKLITTANIALTLKEQAPESAAKYFNASEKLSKSLNFNAFLSDLQKMV